jgi:hypothetical protein
LLLYGSECWWVKKEQMTRTETDEMRFLRAVVGHRMMDRKGNEDIKGELGMKETHKGNNEKCQTGELELLKRIPGSCFINVNRKADDVTEVRPILS